MHTDCPSSASSQLLLSCQNVKVSCALLMHLTVSEKLGTRIVTTLAMNSSEILQSLASLEMLAFIYLICLRKWRG